MSPFRRPEAYEVGWVDPAGGAAWAQMSKAGQVAFAEVVLHENPEKADALEASLGRGRGRWITAALNQARPWAAWQSAVRPVGASTFAGGRRGEAWVPGPKMAG